jgi:hypothetical protein
LVNILLDNPMTQFSFEWILSLNCLCQKWGQVHYLSWKLSGLLLLYFLSGAFEAERPVRVHLDVAAIVYARLLRDADALGRCV